MSGVAHGRLYSGQRCSRNALNSAVLIIGGRQLLTVKESSPQKRLGINASNMIDPISMKELLIHCVSLLFNIRQLAQSVAVLLVFTLTTTCALFLFYAVLRIRRLPEDCGSNVQGLLGC